MAMANVMEALEAYLGNGGKREIVNGRDSWWKRSQSVRF